MPTSNGVHIPQASLATVDLNGGSAERPYSKKQTEKSARQKDAVEKVKKYKEGIEANVVGCLFQEPDNFESCHLTENDFSYESWRTFFRILSGLRKNGLTFTEDNIEFFLAQRPELAYKYKEYQGFRVFETMKAVVDPRDYEGYLNGLNKWNAVLKMADIGFYIDDKLDQFAELTIDDIYNEYSGKLNNAFLTVEDNVKAYNAFSDIEELNERCDKGAERGYDFGRFGDINPFPVLNDTVNGFSLHGQIYGLGAVSGMGKSTMAINYILPLAMQTGQKAVFIINEEDQNKFRIEAETWIINNLIIPPRNIGVEEEKIHYFNKRRFREGGFTPEEKVLLKEAADLMKTWIDTHLIMVIPLERYTVDLAIKIIRKYASLFGVSIFVLDTFKEGADIGQQDTWKAMERDMRALYDTIKESALNVGLFVTYQLGKQSVKTSYLTNAEVGQARNIVDVMSVNLMIRRIFAEEKNGIASPLLYGTKEQIQSDPDRKHWTPVNNDKNYMITFITKNRRGETDPYQILTECNFAFNRFQDVGVCYVSTRSSFDDNNNTGNSNGSKKKRS